MYHRLYGVPFQTKNPIEGISLLLKELRKIREELYVEKGIISPTRDKEQTYKNVVRVQRRIDGIYYVERIVDVQKIPNEGLLITIE